METTKNSIIMKKAVFSAVFLAFALILPMITGQIQAIGQALCPMHIPVILCGFVCGPFWGAAVGIIAPLLRSAIFIMPPMFPTAIAMAFELMTYGLVSALLYRVMPKKIGYIYVSLVAAMLAGRLVSGLATLILLGIGSRPYTFAMFWSGTFVKTLPGIILQLVLIPPLVHLINKIKPKF